MPLPSGIRLRDSCESCTRSKVRCSKHKPSCSRCRERGLPCQYSVTKKTGRRNRERSKPDGRSLTPVENIPSSKTAAPAPAPAPAPEEDLLKAFKDPYPCESHMSDTVVSDLLNASDPLGTGHNMSTSTPSPGPLFDYSNVSNTTHTSLQTPMQLLEWSAAFNGTSPPPFSSVGNAIQLFSELSSGDDIYSSADTNIIQLADTSEKLVELHVERTISSNQPTLEKMTTFLEPARVQDSSTLVVLGLCLHKVIDSYAKAFQFGEDQCVKAGISADPLYEESPTALERFEDGLSRVRSLVVLLGKNIKLTGLNDQYQADATQKADVISFATLSNMHNDLRGRLSYMYSRSRGELERFWA